MIDFDKRLYRYDEQAADDVLNFITKRCKHVYGDSAGLPLIPADFWVEDIIKPAFGIKKKSDNKRRFKTVFLEIGKGNAKSTMGAAIALYLLTIDREQGAQIYGAAGDSSQARIIFETAKHMVEFDEKLSKACKTFQYSIIKNNSSNFYKVISAEAGTKHGYIPTAIIFDELHVQKDRELWDTLTAGQMKITDSITFAFTTAGYDKQSICFEQHEKAIKVSSGIIKDDSFLGIIYAADPKDDISKVDTWRKANPGLGTIITVDNLKTEYQKVISSPSYENTFRRLHLNQWTEQYESWISDNEWMLCTNGTDTNHLKGLDCYGGLDLAATRDFNALILVFPTKEDYLEIVCYFWLPADRLDERMEKQLVDFSSWVKDGFIRITPGNSVDHNIIMNDIKEISKKYNIKSIAYDRKFAAPIVQNLESEIPMSAFDQGIMNISFPTKQLHIMSGKEQLNHFGNPVLRWMMSNVAIYRDPNDNIKVVKHKSTDKVDGVVALIMAIGEWITFKMEGNTSSVYETRGIITIE